MNNRYVTTSDAVKIALEYGARLTDRGIRLAAQREDIPNAQKIGRDWLIPMDGLMYFLENRPKRGRRRKA